jgi:hypothetical protein
VTEWQREYAPAIAAAAAASVAEPAPQRGPGRPPLKRPLRPADSESVSSGRPGSARTNWMDSPFLPDILQAIRQRPIKKAVEWLKATAPDDRYVHLSDSTGNGTPRDKARERERTPDENRTESVRCDDEGEWRNPKRNKDAP